MANAKKKASPKKPSAPAVPFNIAVQKVRSQAYVLESTIASAAGVTTAVYRSMEQGLVHFTRPVYDALVAKFPQLGAAYSAPCVPCPVPVTFGQHPAVQAEYQRTQSLRNLAKRLNIGATNRQIVLDLIRMVDQGHITFADCEEHI